MDDPRFLDVLGILGDLEDVPEYQDVQGSQVYPERGDLRYQGAQETLDVPVGDLVSPGVLES